VQRQQVRDLEVRNWALEEEARRLKEGLHIYRRQESAARRNPEREAAILVHKLMKEQASD
jgi:hypothetical protein